MGNAQRGREQFDKYKGAINTVSFFYKLFPIKMRKQALEKRRNLRGKLGIGLRYAILKSISNSIGDNVALFQGVYLLNPENISIGNNVSIQPMTYIECGNESGGITIGSNVSIAHGVTIMATTHCYNDRKICIKDQGVLAEPVHIEDNVWIGAKAVVLSGVTVRQGCVIGAGAVVTKSTDLNGVYVGVPAYNIKER